MSLFRKSAPPVLDPFEEANDLGNYATAMFDHTVQSLQKANQLLLDVEADAEEQIATLNARQQSANELRKHNARVINRLSALIA